jgi:hypothetical protein
MSQSKVAMLLISGVIFACAGCDSQKATVDKADGNEATANAAAVDHKDPVQSAMAAAPESISDKATIVQAGADGAMKTLREGSNGWTCMPDNPVTPGPDPMCMDANAGQWAMAWIGKKTPPANTVGVMYMLAGGTDASNTDPYAQAPTEGNNWVETGPHLMVVGSQDVLKGHPSGPTPDTKAPYVMWAGTPYAHLMIPVG